MVSASVIIGTVPILMPVLGWAVLREPLRAGILIGAAITVAGTILLVQGQGDHGGGSLKGDLLCVVAVLFICANQLIARRVAQTHGSAAAVSTLQLATAALLSLLVLVTIERPPVYLVRFDYEIAALIGFIGVMGGTIPFVLYNFSLRHMPVGQAGLFVALAAPWARSWRGAISERRSRRRTQRPLAWSSLASCCPRFWSGGGRFSEPLVLIRSKLPLIMAELASPGMERSDMSLSKFGRAVWGYTFACLVIALPSTGPAHAFCISQSFGTATYYTCDGKVGVSHKIGGTTVHSFGGKTATSHTVGATTVHNFNGKSGTSHTVGTTTIHNIGGEFGVSQKIGGITVHSGPLFDSR